jgi:type II secretory pathway pseudopilin PulG
MKRDHRRHAGFFLVDTIFGFIIVGVLAGSLVAAIVSAGRAQRRLEDGATATRIAQRVMATLREGKVAPTSLDEAKITVQAAGGGENIAGREWFEVVVNYHGRTASLTGLAPRGGAK